MEGVENNSMLKILPYTAATDITQAFIYLLHLAQVKNSHKQRRSYQTKRTWTAHYKALLLQYHGVGKGA